MAKKLQHEKLRVVNEYAWNWFSFHAAQRMKVFSFFFVVIGALTAAHYQTYAMPLVAMTFSALGLIFSLLFWRLDLRSRELVKIGEELLLEMERQMRAWGIVNVELVRKANSKSTAHAARAANLLYSHSQVFNAVFVVVAFVSVCGVLISVYRACTLSTF
ncbi:MAG: hypothetical protein KF835_14575 [Xanthobacteraceae bacterium]|nr:hypothetical protein [Xanthobacteraceae bacterium]